MARFVSAVTREPRGAEVPRTGDLVT